MWAHLCVPKIFYRNFYDFLTFSVNNLRFMETFNQEPTQKLRSWCNIGISHSGILKNNRKVGGRNFFLRQYFSMRFFAKYIYVVWKPRIWTSSWIFRSGKFSKLVIWYFPKLKILVLHMTLFDRYLYFSGRDIHDEAQIRAFQDA